jgi:hypothetical protein
MAFQFTVNDAAVSVGCTRRCSAVVGYSGASQAHRHQVRLRRGPLRRLHGSYRRQACVLIRRKFLK